MHDKNQRPNKIVISEDSENKNIIPYESSYDL